MEKRIFRLYLTRSTLDFVSPEWKWSLSLKTIPGGAGMHHIHVCISFTRGSTLKFPGVRRICRFSGFERNRNGQEIRNAKEEGVVGTDIPPRTSSFNFYGPGSYTVENETHLNDREAFLKFAP